MTIRRWLFQVENENGNTSYLDENEFIGTYADAEKKGMELSDEWERKTNGLVTKLTCESQGKVER